MIFYLNYLIKKNSCVIRKANSLKIFKNKEYITSIKIKNNQHRKTVWLEYEIEYLKSNYGNLTVKEMVYFLGKTKKSVVRKLRQLKLFKSPSQVQSVLSKANKKNGRDLNHKLVTRIAKKFNTRHEFCLTDSGAYGYALKNKIIDEVCKHMVVKKFSIPQLILKDILENILNEKCSYNEKKVIKPLEIDCYFPNFKIGWEYNGARYHTNNIKDKIKIKKCNRLGIKLFVIKEYGKLGSMIKYIDNIKNQLISQLNKINKITKLSINKSQIHSYSPKIIYPNLLTVEEKKMCKNKSMTEIKKINIDLFLKIKKYKFYEDRYLKIKNDLKEYKYFKTFNEYCSYLISKNYKSFSEITKKEHPYRIMKKLNLPIEKLRKKIKM